MDTNPGYALAAAILRNLAPGELPALPEVWTAYERRPVRPEELPGERTGDEGTGWAELVVAFLCTEVLHADDEPEERQGLPGLLARIQGQGAPKPVLVPPQDLGDTEIERIHRKALDTALGLGEPPVRAVRFADAVAAGLSRLRPPDV